jgi:hypothetical protein
MVVLAILSPLREQISGLDAGMRNDVVVRSCEGGVAGHELADDIGDGGIYGGMLTWWSDIIRWW